MPVTGADLLIKLAGPNGEFAYQVTEVCAAMARGIEHYNQYNHDLSGFTSPLFWDRGTGKTPPSLVLDFLIREFLRMQNDPRAELSWLYVVPASVKYNWASEAAKWRPDLGPLDLYPIDGPPAWRAKQIEVMKLMRPKVVIINYDLLKREQQAFQALDPTLDGSQPWFLGVTADEAHAVKWAESDRSIATLCISHHVAVALTGTPLTNKPNSVWNVLRFLHGSEWFTRARKAIPQMPKKGRCPLPIHQNHYYFNSQTGCESCRFYQKGGGCTHTSRTGKCWSDSKRAVMIRYRGIPRRWGSYDDFLDQYCTTEYGARGKYVTGGKNLGQLNRRLLDSGMSRLRMADVLRGVKHPLFQYVILDPSAEQADLYNDLRSGFIEFYGSSGEELTTLRVHSVLAQLMYFRRATTLTPYEFRQSLAGRRPEFAQGLQIASEDSGAKQDWLLEMIDDQILGNGDKAVILCDWTDELNPLRLRLRRELGLGVLDINNMVAPGTPYLSCIQGSVDNHKRFQIQTMWNADPDFKVLLLSPAGFEGLNLQGGVSKDNVVYMIFLDMPWLPKDVIQAIGRAHRAGQMGQVVVMFLSMRETIDEYMAGVLKGKQKDVDLAIDGGDVDLARLFEITTIRSAIQMIGRGVQRQG